MIKNRYKIGWLVFIYVNLYFIYGYICKFMLIIFLDYIWRMIYKLMENYNIYIENKLCM